MREIPDGWMLHKNPWGESIAHISLPIWCVFYPDTYIRREHWSAYIAIEPQIKNQHPCEGGVDNKKIGDGSGFKTLEEACRAAEKAAS